MPTNAVASGARLKGRWLRVASASAWRGHVEVGYKHATYSYSYTGRGLALLGTRERTGGQITVDFDGREQRVSLHSAAWRPDQVLWSVAASDRRHTVKITVNSGIAPLDGLAVTDLR